MSYWIVNQLDQVGFHVSLDLDTSEEDPFGAAPFDTEKIRRQLNRQNKNTKKEQTDAIEPLRTGNRKFSSDDLIRF